MVHHPEAREPGLFGGRRDVAESARELGRTAGPCETRDLESEPKWHRGFFLAGRGTGRSEQFGRHKANVVVGFMHGGEPVGREFVVADARPCRELVAQHLRRNWTIAGLVAGSARGAIGVESDRDAGEVMTCGEFNEAQSARAVEGEAVDHREELALQPPFEHEIEHVERVLAGALVVLAFADEGAQAIG